MVDLIDAGVIDPVKVIAALQNAASIAGLLLTTEALVADKPEEAPAMPMGGDPMGGMGMGMMIGVTLTLSCIDRRSGLRPDLRRFAVAAGGRDTAIPVGSSPIRHTDRTAATVPTVSDVPAGSIGRTIPLTTSPPESPSSARRSRLITGAPPPAVGVLGRSYS